MAKPVPYDDDEKPETAEDVLERLQAEGVDGYREAQDIVKRFPKHFALGRWFAGDDTVARSNTRVWKSEFASTQNVDWWWAGGEVLIRLDESSPTPEQEAFDSLDGYPLLDDSDHSELEQEEQTEQWNDWGRKDFKKDLRKYIAQYTDEGSPERKALDEIIDIIGDKDLDRAYWEMCSRADAYPEGGDDIRFPGPEELDKKYSFEAKKRIELWDGTFKGFLSWFGEQPETLIVRLSSKAFCRLHVDDKSIDYKGARFIKFGDEYVLNITEDQVPEAVRDLVRKHADDSAQCVYDCASMLVAPADDPTDARLEEEIARGVAFVSPKEYDEIVNSPFLEVELEIVDKWLARYFHEDISEKTMETVREHAESAVGDRSPATGKVWGLKQPNDLVEKVVELLLRPSSDFALASVGAAEALEEIRRNQPPVCDFRQLKLFQEKRRAPRRSDSKRARRGR